MECIGPSGTETMDWANSMPGRTQPQYQRQRIRRRTLLQLLPATLSDTRTMSSLRETVKLLSTG